MAELRGPTVHREDGMIGNGLRHAMVGLRIGRQERYAYSLGQ